MPIEQTLDPKSPNYGRFDAGDQTFYLEGLPDWLLKDVARGARAAVGRSVSDENRRDTIDKVVRELVHDNRMTADEICSLLVDFPIWGICQDVAALDDGAAIVRNLVAQYATETTRGPFLSKVRWPRNATAFVNFFAPTLRHYQEEYFRYRHGAYHMVDDSTVEAAALNFMVPARLWSHKDMKTMAFNPQNKDVSELVAATRRGRHVERTSQAAPFWLPGATDTPPPRECISLQNGILHVPTRRLLQATPAFFTRNALDFAFDTNATCPLWEKTLAEYWRPKEDGTPADEVRLLQEIVGYLLVPNTSLQKLFIFVGAGRNGKSTVVRVMSRLLGEDNCAATTMHSIADQKSGREPLIGKLAAFIAEVGFANRDDRLTATNFIKAVTGEDPVEIGRKFKIALTVRLMLRFVLHANKVPDFIDDSPAFAARVVALLFTESFVGRENIHLTEQLCEELPGILNWALDGLDRLRETARFTLPETSKALTEKIERMASPVKAFLDDCCMVDATEVPDNRKRSISEDALFVAYRSWCDRNGGHPMKKGNFAEAVGVAMPARIKAYRPRPGDGTRERRFRGVDIHPADAECDESRMPF